jgi:phage FluMu protein Com
MEESGLRCYRCGKCNRKLFEAEEIRERLQIRCPRCKTLNVFGRKQAA